MSVKTNFAHTLYFRRTEKGMKQAEVAEAADLSVRHYQELEIGRAEPHLSTAVRLAGVLGISLDALTEAPHNRK